MLNRPLSNLLSLYSIYTVSSSEVGGGSSSSGGLTYTAQWTNEAYVSRIKSVSRTRACLPSLPHIENAQRTRAQRKT